MDWRRVPLCGHVLWIGGVCLYVVMFQGLEAVQVLTPGILQVDHGRYEEGGGAQGCRPRESKLSLNEWAQCTPSPRLSPPSTLSPP